MQTVKLFFIPTLLMFNCAFSKAQSTDSMQIHDNIKLDEVVVKADKPVVKVKNGIMTYNPRYLMENKIVTNAFDLLKEVSLITCIDDKTLNVIGASKTTVFISGKKSSLDMESLVDYLKMQPAEDVDKIEVIKNPSPKWNTKGAVINVVMKKKTNRSLNGEVKGTLINKHVNSYNASGSLRASTKHYNMDIIYSFTNSNSKSHNTMDGIHSLEDNLYKISTSTDEKSKENKHHLFTNFGYNIGENKSVELSYNGIYTPKGDVQENTENSLFGKSESKNETKSTQHNVMLTMNLSDKLNAGIEYTNYSTDADQNLNTWRNDNDALSWWYEREQTIQRLKGYVDISTPLSKAITLNYGLSYTYVRNNNSQYSDKTESNEENSKLNETTGIAYIGCQGSFFNNKLSLTANLSGELYKIGDYKKNAILPTLGITYVPVSAHIFQLNFGSGRTYPSYWQRQNYTSYVDEYTQYVGNPLLKPAQYYNYELDYILHSKYILQVSYYRVNDFFIQQSYQLPDKLMLMYKMENINYTSNLNFTAVIPLKIKKWYSANLILSLYNEKYKSFDWNGLSYDRSKWTFMTMLNNSVMISRNPKISLTAMMFYRTPSLQGIWDLSRNWTANCGVRYSFCKDKATLSLQCNDIFESLMPSIKVRFDKQNQDIVDKSYRNITLTLSYKINGYKKKEHKEVDNSRYGITL